MNLFDEITLTLEVVKSRVGLTVMPLRGMMLPLIEEAGYFSLFITERAPFTPPVNCDHRIFIFSVSEVVVVGWVICDHLLFTFSVSEVVIGWVICDHRLFTLVWKENSRSRLRNFISFHTKVRRPLMNLMVEFSV